MNNSIKILIVDDEVLIAEYIKDILEENGYSNIKTANTVDEANKIINKFSPQIILLDINIEGNQEGIMIAKSIDQKIPIIFLTAQNDIETITKALQTKPESYLTKPIKVPDLLASINLCQIKHQKKHAIIRNGYRDEIVELNDILYITSEKNYIDIHTLNRKYSIRKSLANFLDELSTDFVQIHRSIVVNKKHIQSKSSNRVLINNIELPISRNFTFNL